MKRLKYLGIIALTILLITGCGKKKVDVAKFLEDNGYKTYFGFGKNTYDKDGNCYKYDYSETQDCKRELEFDDNIAIYSRKDDKEIIVIVDLKDDNEIKNITLRATKRDGDTSYQYVLSRDGSEDYLRKFEYTTYGEECYIVNKTKENKYNDSKCSSNVQDELNEFKNEFQNEIDENDITYDVLFSYYEGYTNEFIFPIMKKAKEDLDTKISYSDVMKNFKKNNISADKYNDSIFITKGNDSLYINMSNGKATGMLYSVTTKKDMFIFKEFKNNYILGAKGSSSKCYYNLTEEVVAMESGCTKDQISDIQTFNDIYYEYFREDLQLTDDELVSFAEEFYERN